MNRNFISVRAEWDQEVKAELDKGKTKPQAVRAVVKKYPKLQQQLIAEANSKPIRR